ncbi:MAG: tetratricopeptide repeat protein [Candidatus Muiribacteriaceae bacterium]
MKMYPDKLNLKGVQYMKSKQYREAIRCFRKAISLNRQYVEAYVNLGITCSDAGLTEEAVNAFTRASVLDPLYMEKYGVDLNRRKKEEWELYHREASIAFYKSEYRKAAEFIDEAIRAKPEYPDYRNLAGEIYLKLGRIEKSRFHLERALELNPSYEKAKRNLAHVLYLRGLEFARDGMEQEMLSIWRKALALYPKTEFLRMTVNLEFTDSQLQTRCSNCETFHDVKANYCPSCGLELR